MTILLTFLQSVPDVIWSALIASVLTLSGVLVSNRSNTQRLKVQLQHDANEKTKERISVLRRDVYLRVAEELVKANAHLAGLPQLDLSKTNLGDGLQGLFSSAARLQLIAEPKTAVLVSKLASEYGELCFKLMTHLMPVSKAKTDIQLSGDMYAKAQAEVTRLLAEMAKLNESGKLEPEVFQALESSFKFHQGQSEKYAEQQSDAWKRFNQNNIQSQRQLLIELRAIGSKQIPVMVEIRRDLGLTGDLAEIEQHMKDQWQRMEVNFDSLIAALSNG